MLPEVVDAIVVVDRTVSLHHIMGAQTVLHNEERLLVAVVQLDERVAQALGINLPTPVACGQVGILDARCQVTAHLLVLIGIDAVDHAVVVGEAHEVHRILRQDGLVIQAKVDVDALALPVLLEPQRVGAAHLHIGVVHVLAVLGLRLYLVARVAVERVGGCLGKHASHERARNHLVQRLGGQRRRHKLVVHALVDHLLAFLGGIALRAVADGGPWVAEHGVDLVEG